jgi:hypothetical protein
MRAAQRIGSGGSVRLAAVWLAEHHDLQRLPLGA